MLGIPRDAARDVAPNLYDEAAVRLLHDFVFQRAHAFSARASRIAVRAALRRVAGLLSGFAKIVEAKSLALTVAPRSTS